MKRWFVVSGLLLAITFAGWGQSLCPAGAIASDSEVVTGVFGTVAIEVCVTRSDGQDTYSYRLTHLGGGVESPCGLLIPGIGRMDTVSASGPTGWSSTTTPSSCGAWWTWSSGVLGSSTGSSLIGRTLTMSVTIDGETTPADVTAAISLCGKTPIPVRILGPSSALTETAFVGTGQRIIILGGGDTQTIAVCEPSWVRHGFAGPESDPDSSVFHLFVDGTEIALDHQVLCVPSVEVGVENALIYYYIQFPADYFTAGVHAVTGVWEVDEIASPPAGYSYDRTITLLVEECGPEPIPLPDLRVQITDAECACGWTKQQSYECMTTVRVQVTNLGSATAASSGLIVTSGQSRSVLGVPDLAPKESYERVVELDLSGVSYGKEPCPFVVEASVDFGQQIEESDEENNTAEYEACCR